LLVALMLCSVTAHAAQEKQRRWLVHFNFGFNLYTYYSGTATTVGQHFTPANRVGIGQQVGVGYFVHPNLRVQLTLQFNETLTGLPASASAFSLFGVIPCLVFTAHGGFLLVGPFLVPRSFGRDEFEAGVFISGGYTFKLPHGFGIAPAVQLPITMVSRLAIAITPLVSLSYRF
jgi:hypothetical protein